MEEAALEAMTNYGSEAEETAEIPESPDVGEDAADSAAASSSEQKTEAAAVESAVVDAERNPDPNAANPGPGPDGDPESEIKTTKVDLESEVEPPASVDMAEKANDDLLDDTVTLDVEMDAPPDVPLEGPLDGVDSGTELNAQNEQGATLQLYEATDSIQIEDGGTSTDGYVPTPREFKMTPEELEAERAAQEAANIAITSSDASPEMPTELEQAAPISRSTGHTSDVKDESSSANQKGAAPENDVGPQKYLNSNETNNMEGARADKAALGIQSAARRRQATKYVEEIRRERAIQNSGAVKIQASVRAQRDRRRVRKLRDSRKKEQQEEEEQIRRVNAATFIQKRSRGMAARNAVAAKRGQVMASGGIVSISEKKTEPSSGEESLNTQVVNSPSVIRKSSLSGQSVSSEIDDVEHDAPALERSASNASIEPFNEDNLDTWQGGEEDPHRLPTPQLVPVGETSLLSSLAPAEQFEGDDAKDLDDALDIMHNNIDTRESATPKSVADSLTVDENHDDFGFDHDDEQTIASSTIEQMDDIPIQDHHKPIQGAHLELEEAILRSEDPATSMHGASPPPKMPTSMHVSNHKGVLRLRWQNGAAVLIQAWQRGTWYRLRNNALLVACKRLYERSRERMEMERIHLEEQAAHERELNAIEMVLSMEQRKSSRLEGAMGAAAKKYEEDMASLQQKQRWGTTRGGGGGGYLIKLDKNGKLVGGNKSGGSVPFTVHAQHRARKEAEARLKKSQAKVVHLKNTIKVLLKKLKTNAEEERQKATNVVGQIRREMILHEKRSLSEISRLTGIVDAMGSDPDILQATILRDPEEASRKIHNASEPLRTIAKSVAKADNDENDFILGAPSVNGGSGGDHISFQSTSLRASASKPDDRFGPRVLELARSEYNGDTSVSGAAMDGEPDLFSTTLPQIGAPLHKVQKQQAIRSSPSSRHRQARMGYKPSAMLQRLDLVGDIAAEEVSPKKLSRKALNKPAPTLSSVTAAAEVEVEARFLSQSAMLNTEDGHTAGKLHSKSSVTSRNGKNIRSDLRKRYGV